MLDLVTRAVTTLRADRRGVTALEYGLIAGLIATIIIGAFTTLGGGITHAFGIIAAALNAT